MKRFLYFLFVFCAIPAMATTWYVRPDGGTRYSTHETSGQCNGQFNLPYPGSGVNQNCAFNDVRYLWADGSYATGTSFPAWGWVGKGGDTYIIDCPNDCRIGYTGPNNSSHDYYLGIAGDPYSSGAPLPPSGTASAHTRILGANYLNCSSDSAKAHINGGYGLSKVFNLAGASYVDMACFNITDHSSCGRSGQKTACSTYFPLSDFATNGILTSNKTTNVTITDVRIHGMASAGMLGPTGDGVSLERVALVGNPSSGWNMDTGNGQTGTGNLTLDHLSLLWNGCSEEYPIVHSLPYQDCTDDQSGGYGDGLGTATVSSNPAWIMTVTNSIAAYNTQDGFDLLHLQGNGSTLTISQSLAYGNMGQQIKAGSASTVRNNLIVGNCNALRQAIPGTPAGYNSRLTDFCRAADTAVALNVQDTRPTYYQFNTMFSANTVGLEVDCSGTCDQSASLVYENNVFYGFLNSAATGYPKGGNGRYPGAVYLSTSGLFTHPGSVYSNNATYHSRTASCPIAAYDEINAICTDPGLTDETWHVYGFGNMAPADGSRVIGMGVAIPTVTLDQAGNLRPNPPSIGALENHSSTSSSNPSTPPSGSSPSTPPAFMLLGVQE